MRTAEISDEGLEYAIRIYEDGQLIDCNYVNGISISLSDLREIGGSD